ncbi:MAG TPA: hypothetical protein VL689_20185 [Paraburkholderia sp.]|nr:hypothetical protein [Paraburkholderia sp.]
MLIALCALCALSGFVRAQPVPSFSDCATPVEARRISTCLVFSDARARRYQSVIRDAAKGPVNFAGHFVLATWGCGASCVMAAVIDAKTGRVTSLPFTVSNWPEDITEPLSWRADSCLLVVEGSRNESDERGRYCYLFDGNTFTLRRAVRAPEREAPSMKREATP